MFAYQASIGQARIKLFQWKCDFYESEVDLNLDDLTIILRDSLIKIYILLYSSLYKELID